MSNDLVGRTLLGRYFLREIAGTGGMADVFRAWDTQRSTTVAIKVLRRDIAQKSQTFTLFNQEAELLRELAHPNIVRFYEFEHDESDVNFLVMDWVDGINLRDKIQKKNQPFDLAEVSRVLGPICTALNYAHKKSVFHCDVKPPNILLHQDGRVLLTDFGVARFSGTSGTGGTPPYMAPEQFTDGDTGPYTDVYGLGVTLYEMLSGGQIPFRGESSLSIGSTPRERIAWEHVNLPIPPLRALNRNLDGGVERVVMKALEKKPVNRYSSTMALFDAFEQACMAAGPERKDPLHTPESVFQTFIQPLRDSIEPLRNSLASLPARQTPPSQAPRPLRPNGPHLYGVAGVMQGQVINIPKNGSLIIGRNSTNHIHLPETSVSRVHASIIITQRGVYIQDEGSSFGTLLNGNKIQPRVPALLKHGDVIQIGYQQVLEFKIKG